MVNRRCGSHQRFREKSFPTYPSTPLPRFCLATWWAQSTVLAAVLPCAAARPLTLLCRALPQVEVRYVLLEAAAGYCLMERKEGSDEISAKTTELQAAVVDFPKFAKIMSLKAFVPFRSAEDALENITAVSEGSITGVLQGFLEQNFPGTKPGKKSKFALGVMEHKLGQIIQEAMGITCVCNDLTAELLRGVRAHLTSFLKALKPGDLEKAQLGLAHSYSRSKVRRRC